MARLKIGKDSLVIERDGKDDLNIPIASEEELIEQQAVIVASPVKWGPSSVPSDVVQCSTCEQDVWLSRKSSVPMYEKGLIAMCIECMVKMQRGGKA